MTRLGLIVGAVFVLLGAVMAFAESTGARADCSTLDVAAIAMIEEHGRVADVPSDRLYGAALVMQEARQACRDERFNEARALYEVVFSLGPAAGQASDE